jgi:hypothetical protein
VLFLAEQSTPARHAAEHLQENGQVDAIAGHSTNPVSFGCKFIRYFSLEHRAVGVFCACRRFDRSDGYARAQVHHPPLLEVAKLHHFRFEGHKVSQRVKQVENFAVQVVLSASENEKLVVYKSPLAALRCFSLQLSHEQLHIEIPDPPLQVLHQVRLDQVDVVVIDVCVGDFVLAGLGLELQVVVLLEVVDEVLRSKNLASSSAINLVKILPETPRPPPNPR